LGAQVSLLLLLLLLLQMMGVPEEEAVRLVAAGQRAELLDRVYASFAAYKEMHDMVIVHGTAIGEGQGLPWLVSTKRRRWTSGRYANADVMDKRRILSRHTASCLRKILSCVDLESCLLCAFTVGVLGLGYTTCALRHACLALHAGVRHC
jgi:hypothetical protein